MDMDLGKKIGCCKTTTEPHATTTPVSDNARQGAPLVEELILNGKPYTAIPDSSQLGVYYPINYLDELRAVGRRVDAYESIVHITKGYTHCYMTIVPMAVTAPEAIHWPLPCSCCVQMSESRELFDMPLLPTYPSRTFQKTREP